MIKLVTIYLSLIILSISCNTEEENKKLQENKQYQVIQTLLNKYKTEYQAQEIVDSGFIYTKDYQMNFTNKDILITCGEDYRISGENGTMYLSRIEDVFNKNDTTFLQILCDSQNYNFKIYSILKCLDSLISRSKKMKSSTLFIVAHISDVDRMVFNATGQDNGDGTYSVAVDMEETVIVLLGQCKKI